MQATARRRPSLFRLSAVFLLIWYAGAPVDPATAGEVPTGHCSVQASFSDLADYLDSQVATLMESYGIGNVGQVSYRGSSIDIDEEGQHTNDTSDGDMLTLTLTIDVPIVADRHIYADFFLRETPPASQTCTIARVLAWNYYQIGPIMRRCIEYDNPDHCVTLGYEYYHGGLISNDILSHARGDYPWADPTGDMQPCNRLFFEDASQFGRWGLQVPINPDTGQDYQWEEGRAVLCERKTIHLEEVTTGPEDFPGPMAAEISHDFEPFGNWNIPGSKYTIQQYIDASGANNQYIFVPVNPEDPNSPLKAEEVHSGRCFLQQLLKENLGAALGTSIGVEPFVVAMRDLPLLGGGVRVSKAGQHISFLIPNLLQTRDAEPDLPAGDPQPCTWRPLLDEAWFMDKHGEYRTKYDTGRIDLLTAMLSTTLEYVDFPKMVHHYLQSNADAQALGLRIACDMGQDCASNGGDTDGDGFCDGGPNPDYCPELPTSANCDWDGDGIGDAPSQLIGRPAHDGRPEVEASCLSDPTLPVVDWDSYQGEKRQQIIQFACGGCDNCGRVSNPDLWRRVEDLPHELELPNPFNYWGSDKVDPGTWQPDWDHDWIGDACDPDIDGDGFRNELDCEPMNPDFGMDLDRDGVCEHVAGSPIDEEYDVDACIQRCEEYGEIYQMENPSNPSWGPPYHDISDCRIGCWIGRLQDNCAPSGSTDFYCESVRAHCVRPWVSDEQYAESCTPEVMQLCAMQYANPPEPGYPPVQTDSDGDGVGDKCDLGAFGLELVPDKHARGFHHGPTTTFGCWIYGQTYSPRMRTYGGNASWPDLTYQPELRTAFEVGACACEQDPETSWLQGDLDWKSSCWEFDCPDNHNGVRGEEDANRIKYWNPVSDPAYAATHPSGCSGASCLRDAERIAKADDGALVYGRAHAFTRDESENLLDLGWSWKDAREAWWPDGVAYADAPRKEYSARSADPQLVTRARAVWPDYSGFLYGPIIGYDYDPERGVSYSSATLVDERQGACFGEVYLGPPFVVEIIPHWVDLWGWERGQTWLGGLAGDPIAASLASRPLVASVLGWSEPGGELLLYRYGADGLALEVAQRFTGAAPDPLARVSATVGRADGAIWDLPAGGHQAVFIYQQPYLGSSPDPSHGGDMIPGRLLMGRLSEGEAVTLRDAVDIAGQQAPSLLAGRVLYQPRSQQVLLIGRTTSEQGAWGLASLSLASGRWSPARTLPLASGDRLMAAELDPVSRRVLLLVTTLQGGAAAAPEPTVRALWLDPVTGAVSRAAPDAPADLVRSRASVSFDPRLRQLLVAGGERDGTLAGDVWRLDLGRQAWTPLAQMPDALLDPMVYWDASRKTLWLGEVRTDDAGLEVWAYSQVNGSWIQTFSPVVPRVPSWPVDGVYVPGSHAAYPFAVEAATPPPGTVVLGRLTAGEPWLGLALRSGSGELLSTSEIDPVTGEALVAALCTSRQTCELALRATGGSAAPWVPFTLDARPATLAPAGLAAAPGTARSLARRGDLLYLAGPAGVRILRASTLDELAWARAPGLQAGRAAALCGGRYLCLARPGKDGLVVADIARPDRVTVAARADLGAGDPHDLAVQGWRAYVALGRRGVAIVSLSSPLQPSLAGRLAPGGSVVSVAAAGGLLAAGLQDGRVRLYDIRGEPRPVGSLDTGSRLSTVRFVAGQLFVLDRAGRAAQTWQVTGPAAPVLLGSFTENAALLTTGRWQGRRLYAVDGHHLHVLMAN